jgi:uncharacterized protein (TIGR02679 family)
MRGLDSPALERALRTARAARERRGSEGDARLVIPVLSPEEAIALDALPWPGRSREPILPGRDLRVALGRFEEAVRTAGVEPFSLYERFGGPMRDLRAERRLRRSARDAFWQQLARHPVIAARPALGTWLQDARTTGKLRPGDEDRIEQALRVIAALPRTPTVERSALAAEILDGRPHALDADTPMERLVRSMLHALAGLDERSASGGDVRALWLSFGVECDVTACTVLALGLRPLGNSPLARSLHTLAGSHVVLTLGQLQASPLRWPAGKTCFVCENPAVIRAVERRLGDTSPPVVCTGGWPNSAVHELLASMRAGGTRLLHHGDFDWDGVAIHDHLARRLDVEPWRFDTEAYQRATDCVGLPLPRLRPPRRRTAHALVAALESRGVAIAEELVIDVLLEDLSGQARRAE